MKQFIQKALHGKAGIVSKGRSFKLGILAAGLATCLVALTPAAKAITQLEYLQVMVQLCGEGASFAADSSPADFVQWARNKGMEPTGGWNANAKLTPSQLAQALVQLYGLNPKKSGSDPFRILEREGIIIDQSSDEVSRSSLAGLFDEFGFQSRTAELAKASTTSHGKSHKPPKPPKNPKPPKHPKPPKEHSKDKEKH